MKVYELIQELSQYKADTEVEFHVKAKFDTAHDFNGSIISTGAIEINAKLWNT